MFVYGSKAANNGNEDQWHHDYRAPVFWAANTCMNGTVSVIREAVKTMKNMFQMNYLLEQIIKPAYNRNVFVSLTLRVYTVL